ncbi:MAG: recombinase family protein [Hyphomonadaceae bacterium]
MKKLRCAIYTRKSTDEGLDQSFNSLDAQREACGAYILSQAGEGWVALKEIYDDGGFSGGSMERPALTRLLADIQAGKIDIVVVYKVDRLTRSLADFARIVETLDAAKASFVSVTQAFNTTTSMGRLTLNVLLSFAQFEREVTGERIRDKIAASKAKGMWMGGNPPLGYDPKERSLAVNAAEAAIVQSIFTRYLSVPNVFALRDTLARDGIVSKRWTSRAGRDVGGGAFTHGALYHILSNRIYLGEIVHRGKAYPGQHQPIIAADLFAAVQDKLKARAPNFSGMHTRGRRAPLLGKLFDDRGHPMTAAHANKGKRRYFYYVSTALNAGKTPGSLARVSAPRLEQLIVDFLSPQLISDWGEETPTHQHIFDIVQRIELTATDVIIDVADGALREDHRPSVVVEQIDQTRRIIAPHDLKRPTSSRQIISSDARTEPSRVDRALVRALINARRWTEMLAAGEAASIQGLAKREDVCPIHTGQILPLAFLAPDLVGAIVEGRQPRALTLSALLAKPLPLGFADQRRLFAQFH